MTAAPLVLPNTREMLTTLRAFNEHKAPTHAGKLRADVAEKLALERYESFDASRRETARLAADAEDMESLERAERALEGTGRGKKK